MKKPRFPPGWDEKRVRRVLAHYETQTEEESVTEDQAAFQGKNQTVMKVPPKLVPIIRALIAKYQA